MWTVDRYHLRDDADLDVFEAVLFELRFYPGLIVPLPFANSCEEFLSRNGRFPGMVAMAALTSRIHPAIAQASMD